jgi:hypothetical protein
MNMNINMNVTTPSGVRSPASPLRRHRRDRPEIHNIEVDEALAGQHLSRIHRAAW